jgi:hypothetical protein
MQFIGAADPSHRRVAEKLAALQELLDHVLERDRSHRLNGLGQTQDVTSLDICRGIQAGNGQRTRGSSQRLDLKKIPRPTDSHGVKLFMVHHGQAPVDTLSVGGPGLGVEDR